MEEIVKICENALRSEGYDVIHHFIEEENGRFIIEMEDGKYVSARFFVT